ncbi:MAG: hypothetical protein ACEQSL_11635 [Sediminibacterium sp.]
MGKLIASGTIDEIVNYLQDENIPADIRQLREAMKLTGEFHFYMGLYEVKKVKREG